MTQAETTQIEDEETTTPEIETSAPPMQPTPVVGPTVAEAAGLDPIKGTELIGYPVVSRNNGEEVGRIQDVVFDPFRGRLVGFRLRKEGWFGPRRTLPFADVSSIGADVLMIESPTALVDATPDAEVEQTAERGESVVGKRLLTESGDFLGAVHDILVNRHTGQIAGYEVSGGLYEDVMKGRHLIRAVQIQRIGEDFAIVPDAVKHHIEADIGGLTGAFDTLGEKAARTWEATREKAGEVRDDAARSIEEREAEYALGKAAGYDVRTEAGELLIAEGGIIDAAVIQRARAEGAMHVLAAAAGKSAVEGGIEAVQIRLARTAEVVRDRAAEAADTVQERVAEASESARTRATAAGTAAEERGLEYAVGRIAGRTVIDATGRVIVASGQVITAEAAERARAVDRVAALVAAAGEGQIESGVEDLRERAADLYAATRQRATDTYESASERVGEVYEATSEEVQDTYARARHGLSGAATGDLLGRVADREVRDDAGNRIVAPGETITADHIAAAQEAGKISLLRLAVQKG